jgi:hypothetical protein
MSVALSDGIWLMRDMDPSLRWGDVDFEKCPASIVMLNLFQHPPEGLAATPGFPLHGVPAIA